jgi:hypothetical protein
LLDPVNLTRIVVTSDAMPTQREHVDNLVTVNGVARRAKIRIRSRRVSASAIVLVSGIDPPMDMPVGHMPLRRRGRDR